MIKIYLHGQGTRDVKLVEMSEEPKKSDVIRFLPAGHQTPDEFEVFLDEDEDPVEDELPRLKPKQHIVIHRCRKVLVTVTYNGQQNLEVPPNTKISKLLRLAADAFSITKDDSADLVLTIGNETLEPTSRIGSYVAGESCSVNVSLVPNKQVKG